MRIHVKQLPCDQATFLRKRDEYFVAREAHSLTVHEPAPFPEFEILRTLYESGEALEIYDDQKPIETAVVAKELAEQQAQADLAAARAVVDTEVAALEALIAKLPPDQRDITGRLLRLVKGDQ